MRRIYYFIGTVAIFSFFSVNFEREAVDFANIANYNIINQPFSILMPPLIIKEVMYITILISAFTFYFMGDIQHDMNNSGMYYVLRYQSKQKWFNRKFINANSKLVILCMIYVFISILTAFMLTDFPVKFNSTFLVQLLLFYASMLLIIQLQMLFEIYLKESLANLIVISFSIISILIYNQNSFLKSFLVVNNISIYRSGAYNQEWQFNLIVLLTINICIYIISNICIGKKDFE